MSSRFLLRMLSLYLASQLIWLGLSQYVQAQEARYQGRSLSQWQADLADLDSKVRREAVKAIAHFGSQAVPTLTKTLKDPSWEVRTTTVDALRNMGPAARDAAPDLVKALSSRSDDPSYLWLWTVSALAAIGPAAMPALIEGLSDFRSDVRNGVIKAMVEIGIPPREAIQPLIEALEDSNRIVRANAAFALGKIGPPAKQAIPTLTKLLTDPDADVRAAASKAVGAIDPKATVAIEPLVRGLSGDWLERKNAIESLSKMGKAAVPAVTEALRDRDVKVRLSAAFVLGEIGSEAKDAVPALIIRLKDHAELPGGIPVNQVVAEALGKIGPPARDAVRPLLDAVERGGVNMTDVVQKALTGIGPPALPAIIEGLNHNYSLARSSAAYAIGKLGPAAADAVPALIHTLENDEDWYVRGSAAYALGQIGPVTSDVIPALIRAVKRRYRNYPVQLSAAKALGRIGPAAKDALPALHELARGHQEFQRIQDEVFKQIEGR